MANKNHQNHSPLESVKKKVLHQIAYQTIKGLESPYGINASGKEDLFCAFFGRDSMITSLKLLKIHTKKPDSLFLRIIKKTLSTAAKFQGTDKNPASGEEPGKIIHEFRDQGYQHLISGKNPWYVYPDKTLRNYDSVDSTPLFLILAAEFYNLTNDQNFLKEIIPSVTSAFEWIEKYSHKSDDQNKIFVEYLLERQEPYGGLFNQGWMDSTESLFIMGKPAEEPVALVEVQAYYFKALKLWAEIYTKIDSQKSQDCHQKSIHLKKLFNQLFLIKSEGFYYFSQGIFGNKAHIQEIRSNPGHCLWASVNINGKQESIIEDKFLNDVVQRLMQPDIFEPKAGIRTLSKKSSFFDPFSYHNGSIWPFDNGLIAEGFENFGYTNEAKKIKKAILTSIAYFGTSVELYCADANGKLQEYQDQGGFFGSHQQAWTAATVLDFTTS